MFETLKKIYFKISSNQDQFLITYEKNSLKSMIYVCALIMLADKKIKKAELRSISSHRKGLLMSAFLDTLQSIEKKDFDEIIEPTNQGSNFLSSNELNDIITNAHNNLLKLPIEIVLANATSKVTNKDCQKICLLGSIRVAACDLELNNIENIYLQTIAINWGIEDLLKRIINNLPNWEKNRTGRLANKITDSRKGISKLIDEGTISLSTFNKLEELISVEAPSLEIHSEWEDFAKEVVDENENLGIENKTLKNDLDNLIIKLARTTKEIERQSSFGNDEESIRQKLNNYKNIEFHSSVKKILIRNFPNKQDVYLKFAKINEGNPSANKPVKGAGGWKEISKVKTGEASTSHLGRIYIKNHKSESFLYKAYIDVKKDKSHQEQAIKLLRNWL